jgi:hypothetical protein
MMFSLAAIIGLIHASAPVGSIQNCSVDFISTCITSASPAGCDACVKTLKDCGPVGSKVLDEVCTKAPFNQTTEGCYSAIVNDCSADFTDPATCAACFTKNAADMKSKGCSDGEISNASKLCAAIPTNGTIPGIENCSISFVDTCLTSQSVAACDDCVKGLKDCDPISDKAFDLVCTKAPFNASTESCYKEMVNDCVTDFTDPTTCNACFTSNSADLKAKGCSDSQIAGAEALCAEIPTNGTIPAFENCSIAFTNKCLDTKTPALCDTCVEGLSACGPQEQLPFKAICTEAPFNSTTETCFKGMVGDCASELHTAKTCEACFALHSFDLKKKGCTTKEIAGVTALCTQLPNSTSTTN